MLLLNEIKDNTIVLVPQEQMQEQLVESFEFELEKPSTVMINIIIPFQVYRLDYDNANAAVRVYLNGQAFHPQYKQWDGELLLNGGQWCAEFATPPSGRCSGSVILELDEGTHTIRTHGAVSFPANPYDSNTHLRVSSRRRYQVYKL